MNSGLVLSEVSFFVDVELDLLSAAGITILAFDEDVEFVTVVIVGVLLLLFFSSDQRNKRLHKPKLVRKNQLAPDISNIQHRRV